MNVKGKFGDKQAATCCQLKSANMMPGETFARLKESPATPSRPIKATGLVFILGPIHIELLLLPVPLYTVLFSLYVALLPLHDRPFSPVCMQKPVALVSLCLPLVAHSHAYSVGANNS